MTGTGILLLINAEKIVYYKVLISYWGYKNFLFSYGSTYLFFGIFLFVLAQIIKPNILSKINWVGPLIVLIFTIWIMDNYTMGGVNRSANFSGIYIRTGYLILFMFVIFASRSIALKDKSVSKREEILFYINFVLSCLIFILQPDIYILTIIIIIFFMYSYLSKKQREVYIASILSFIIMLFTFIMNYSRIKSRLIALGITGNMSFQNMFSLRAIFNGGLTGRGLINFKNILPDASIGFIFSVIGYSFGLLGLLIIMALFFLYFYSGLKAVVRVDNRFEACLIYTMNWVIILFTLIGMLTPLGLLPVNGEGIPFLGFDFSKTILGLLTAGFIFRGLKGSDEHNVLNINIKNNILVVLTVYVLVVIRTIFLYIGI